jgi:hypothetical protein
MDLMQGYRDRAEKAIGHLRAILPEDPADNEFDVCMYCHAEKEWTEWNAPLAGSSALVAPTRKVQVLNHKPDCPYVTAKAFLESLKS